MKEVLTVLSAVTVALFANVGVLLAGTPLSMAFTYQAQLKDTGALVTDTCDLEFSLWDDAGAGQLQAMAGLL